MSLRFTNDVAEAPRGQRVRVGSVVTSTAAHLSTNSAATTPATKPMAKPNQNIHQSPAKSACR